jgi:hypothetical protein
MIHRQDAPKLSRRWLHDSGGLIWHLRALHYRHTPWQDFRQTVSDWLGDWQPPTDKLLIIGPSAGYTLPGAFLRRWQEITVLEPDPLARWLLRRRHRDVRWCFDTMDVLSDDEGLSLLAPYHDTHAVLFSNVLGQTAPRDDAKSPQWKQRFRENLATHHWASYHDVISTKRTPDAASLQCSADHALTLDDVLGHFWHGGELELVDHYTFGLGAHEYAGRAYCIWPLQPNQYHLVEWITGTPRASGADDEIQKTKASQ